MSAIEEPRVPTTLGGFDSRRDPFLRCDVLVLGSGIAGAAAALAAADAGADVLVVSKSELAESNTSWAQGGVAAVVGASDSVALHVEDTLRVGAGLADPTVVRGIVEESPATVAWLEGLGVAFDHDGEALALSREGGHSVSRVVHHGDDTGAAIQTAIELALRAHPNVSCRSSAFARELVLREGRCAGAVLLTEAGVVAVEAAAVVVATGGAGQVYRETTNPIGACGDGMALCFRAGAKLVDMEFVQFHPTTLYIAGASRFLISEVVRGAGALLRDRHGTRFMEGVHPSAELAPRDVVSRAILDRMVAIGDTHVYLDLSPIDDPHRRFPTISRICRAFDIDIAKDPIPVRPGAHYFVGGVHTDVEGRTDVAGLFAAGEVACTGLHGANRLASNSLLEGAVVGRRAGRLAAAEATSPRAGLPRHQMAPPQPPDAPRIQLDDMLYSLKSLMWRNVGLSRMAEGMQEALRRIGMWHHYLMRANPRTIEAFQLANMLVVSALTCRAAIERSESRGTHFRSDEPHRHDDRWCRHIALTMSADGTIDARPGQLQPPTDAVSA